MPEYENKAAWLTGAGKPLEVKPALSRTIKPDQIRVKNYAIAINPIDWILQRVGTMAAPKLPFILGNDVAGEVVEVGRQVTRFKKGDRVVGQAVLLDPKNKEEDTGSFQLYTILHEHMASPLPNKMRFENAAVMPLALSTAACGLFEENQLSLPYPSLKPEPRNQTLLVWGGSTSVGCNAIQLAVAAGYEVFATSSPKNFALVRSLGASQVFDYNDASVVDQIVQAMNGKTTAGAISMGSNSALPCIDILSRCKGNKFVSMASYPGPLVPPERFLQPRMVYNLVTGTIRTMIRSWLKGVRTGTVQAATLVHSGVGQAIYVDFLPTALERGQFVAAPEPVIVGSGLEALQGAMDAWRRGVSAKKIVVTLD